MYVDVFAIIFLASSGDPLDQRVVLHYTLYLFYIFVHCSNSGKCHSVPISLQIILHPFVWLNVE